MLAAIGTVVASVTTVMGKAMKSVKSAKFAQGGKVKGQVPVQAIPYLLCCPTVKV